MAPMLTKPLPRPVGKKQFRSEAEAAAKKQSRGGVGHVIAAGALAVGAVTLLVVAALRSDVSPKPIPPGTVRPVEKLVETSDRWFETADAGALAEPVKEAIRRNPRLTPGHKEIKTNLVRVNLRTLVGPLEPKVEEGKQPPAPPSPEPGGMSGGVPPVEPRPTEEPLPEPEGQATE